MKFFIALTTLLIASASFAQQQNQPPIQNPDSPTTPPKVFEQTKVKITMFKNTIERVGDSFEERKENICTKEVVLNVYDIRGNPSVQLPPLPRVSCPGVFENKNYDFTVWLYTLVYNHATQNYEMKNYYANMSVSNNNGMEIPKNLIMPNAGNVSTKQLDLKSLIFNLTPQQGVYCMSQSSSDTSKVKVKYALPLRQKQQQDCQIMNPVAFGAEVEFETL